MFHKLVGLILAAFILASSAGAPVVKAAPPPAAWVDERVREAVAANGRAPVLVGLRDAPPVGAPRSEVAQRVAAAQQRVLDRLPAGGMGLRHRFSHVPGLAGEVNAGGLAALAAQPGVATIALDEPTEAHDRESLAGLGVPALHAGYGLTGQGVVVAVVDTGVDTANPDFAGRLVAEKCFVAPSGCQPAPGAPASVPESAVAMDLNGHGTNVAGVAAGGGALDPLDTLGVAPAAGLVAVRVLGATGGGTTSDWIAGLNWLYGNAGLGVRVVNLSLGTMTRFPGPCDDEPSQFLARDATARLTAAGVVIFASSGNQGDANGMTSPACLPAVIAVGATYDIDLGREPNAFTWQSVISSFPACYDEAASLNTVACFSNSSRQLGLLAPGAWIASSKLGGGVSTYVGTSQAAPAAAGVAALMLQANPALTPAQVRQLLRDTAGAWVTDPRNGRVFPRLDAFAAVRATTAPVSLSAPPLASAGWPVTIVASLAPLTPTAPVTYTWRATGQTPSVHVSGLMQDSWSFTWPAPGRQLVTATVEHAGVLVTPTLAISVSAIPLASVSLAGPALAAPGAAQAYTASADPLTTSLPITYTWQASGLEPVTRSVAGASDTFVVTSPLTGTFGVTVTASSLWGGTGTAAATTTIVQAPPEVVTVVAPAQALAGQPVTLVATVGPAWATQPLTYTWQVAGEPPVVRPALGVTDAVTFAWPAAGLRGVTVTVANSVGTASGTAAVDVVPWRLWLPAIHGHTG